MKALLTASNTQILFFLKRYISHAFTNLLKNIARKIFYTLFPFGFSLACLYKTQEKTLKTKWLHIFYTKEMALVYTNKQRKTPQQNTPTIYQFQCVQSQI